MPMKVAIVNKFWYARGGDCVVAMNTAALLRRMGHEVRIFSMHHPDNAACDDEPWFASQVFFDGNISQKFKALYRSLGDKEVKEKFSSFLGDFRPDVVHLHNIHSYLSPIVAKIAHAHNCRVVWTLHDYKLLCPAYSCLRRGQVCSSCIEHPLDVVSNRCMKNSLIASLAGLFELSKWNAHVLAQCVDVFICPSRFMATQMQKGDFPAEKLAVISNFLPDEDRGTAPVVTGRADYCCYVGRLSAEKGVETLLEAVAATGINLKVAGDGPLSEQLSGQYAHCKNIEFLGRLNGHDVMQLLRLARFSVTPSVWWENNPMSVIESLCTGTPVVGSDIGGIPELIDSSCGLLAPAGNPAALAATLQQAWNRKWDHAAIARNAAIRFSPHEHYRALLNCYTA